MGNRHFTGEDIQMAYHNIKKMLDIIKYQGNEN